MGKNKDIDSLFIRSKHQGPYRRAGFVFTREPFGIALNALTKEQIAALKSDPHLVVQECTFPADELGDGSQPVLVGTDALPAHVLIAEGVEVPLGDIVAMAFTAAAATPEVGVITADDWNAESFNEQREKVLQEAVDALKRDPAIYQEFLKARAQASEASPGKQGKATRQAKGKK